MTIVMQFCLVTLAISPVLPFKLSVTAADYLGRNPGATHRQSAFHTLIACVYAVRGYTEKSDEWRGLDSKRLRLGLFPDINEWRLTENASRTVPLCTLAPLACGSVTRRRAACP
jgi:hypothetical protein